MADEVEYAELFGRVTRIIEYGKNNKPSLFIVHTSKMNKNFTVRCPFFAPIQESDSIYAICSFSYDRKRGEILQIERPPFVQLSLDKDSVLKCFMRILRGTGFGNIKAHQL